MPHPHQLGTDTNHRRQNRLLSTPQLLELLHAQAPRLWEIAQVVGRWVWIAFEQQPPRETTAKLSEFGFRWNRKRHCWQHPCGDTCTIAANYDPRQRYGCRPAVEIAEAKGGF